MASHPFSWIGPLALPRLTLLLNHVVSSEPLAAAKLQPHAGRAIDIRWKAPQAPALPGFLGKLISPDAWTPPPLRLVITPAGLFEAVDEPLVTDLAGAYPATPAQPAAGLTLTVSLPDPIGLAKLALKAQRPDVNIEGDAALAEAASWLMKNLRWDLQDDLARWLGNTPAEFLRQVGGALSQALQRWRPGQPSGHNAR